MRVFVRARARARGCGPARAAARAGICARLWRRCVE